MNVGPRERIHAALRRAQIPLAIPAAALFVSNEDVARVERRDVGFLAAIGEWLKNGSRAYFDVGHLEISTPETLSPVEMLLYEKAGERMVRATDA